MTILKKEWRLIWNDKLEIIRKGKFSASSSTYTTHSGEDFDTEEEFEARIIELGLK